MAKTGRPKNKRGYGRITFYLPRADMEYLKGRGRLEEISASEYLHALIDIDRDHHQEFTQARAKMDEKLLLKIAQTMHGELCDCDDKTCELTGEIYDWLYNADQPDALTLEDVPALIKEWKEYDGQQ